MQVRTTWRANLAFVATDPSTQLTVATIDGAEQKLSQWLTTFNLLAVVIDPYTHESGWICLLYTSDAADE
mgnify:CR=1 FL=1